MGEMQMKRSIAAVAATAVVMTAAGTVPAFAAGAEHARHARHAARVKMTGTTAIKKKIEATAIRKTTGAVAVDKMAAAEFGRMAGTNAVHEMADTTTISTFVQGRYLIMVRYMKDDPLPRQFDMPLTLKAVAQQEATPSELAALQRSYQSLASGSIQVLMLKPPTDPPVVQHAQQGHLHGHAHINTGFGGEARLVAHHFPHSTVRR
jgi:hypothetical protein